MQDYTIERVNKADLSFNGELIGKSASDKARITIYRLKSGKFIGSIKADATRFNADRFDKPADLITWLKSHSYGSLTEDAQSAVEEAAKNDETFRAFWTEKVE
jgi:hypothetical protein